MKKEIIIISTIGIILVSAFYVFSLLNPEQKNIQLKVWGTEYQTEDQGTIWLQLLRDLQPINNATCYATAYYPDKTTFLDKEIMSLLKDGIYYYDLTIPSTTGVYMLSANCKVPQDAFIDDFIDYSNLEAYSNMTIVNNKIQLGTASNISLSPYAWWHLNEPSGTTVSDSSGNGRNGTTIFNPTWVAGKLNNALQFDGTSQYVDFGNASFNFERTDSASYEFWFNTSNSAMRVVLSKYDATTTNKGLMIYLTSGYLWFDLRGSSSGYLAVSTTNSFNDGVWHHAIITYNGTSSPSGVAIYVDGIAQNLTINKDTLVSSTLNIAPFYMGKRSAGNQWSGKLDEVVIYNKTLNANEVNFRYNNGTGTEQMGILINATSGFIQSKPISLNESSWVNFSSDYTLNSGNITFKILDQNNNTLCAGLGDTQTCANATSPIKLYAQLTRPSQNDTSSYIDRWWVNWFLSSFEEVKGSSELHITKHLINILNATENITNMPNVDIIS